jgi:PEGA domain
MKRLNRILLLGLALAMVVPALPASAAPGHGGGHGGGRGGHFGGGHFGGRTRVFVGGGWGWGWGWPGYYGYYGYGPGYERQAYGPAEQWATIDTDISPEEAQVYLDGRYIGTADDFDGNPDYLYLKPGRYRIEFRLEGYETLTRQIEARPGTYLDFTDKLHKIRGGKQHGSYERPKQQGEVLRYYGKGRGSVEPVDPSSQPPEASVSAGEGSDEDQTPPAEDRPPARRPLRDRDQYGERGAWRDSQSPRAQARTRLRLNVEPSDAAVYVDNRFVGTAEEVNSLERGVSVSPGKHTVTVSRPGFRDKTSDITVEPGKTETLEISLGH